MPPLFSSAAAPAADTPLGRPSIVASRTACDLCGGQKADVVLPLPQRALVACAGCGLVRLDPMPTARELSEVYDTEQYYTHAAPRIVGSRADRVRNAVLDAFWNYPNHHGRLATALLRAALWPLRDRAMPVPFPGDGPVLDIGCGNGQRLLELQSRGCTRLYGVEPTIGAAEQARIGTQADIRSCLLEDANLPDDHFRLIVMNQVLEHVPSPSATLRRVRNMLAADGSLYLTVPNFGALEAAAFGTAWSGLQIPAHLHHFTPAPLRRLIQEAGLRVVTWRTDTVLAVTAASLFDWRNARPTAWRRTLQSLPRLAWAPATLAADLLGRGQMLRVVARRD